MLYEKLLNLQSMKKLKIIFGLEDYKNYVKSSLFLLLKSVMRIPYMLLTGIVSMVCWMARKVKWFCCEYTKAAVIIGFAICLFVMICEFVYFKVQLRQQQDAMGELIKDNYKLEQVDRYDVGYHDAMRKNSQMAQVKIVE